MARRCGEYYVPVLSLLKECGSVLLRTKRHTVYRLPNGYIFSLASTSSDRRAAKNAMSHLKKMLLLSPTKSVSSGSDGR
jgi:hypothetical protein